MININDFAPRQTEKVAEQPKRKGKRRAMTIELEEGEQQGDDIMYSELSESENEHRKQKIEPKEELDPIEEAKQMQIDHLKGEIHDIIQARTNSSPNHSSKRGGSSASELLMSKQLSKQSKSPIKPKEPATPKRKDSNLEQRRASVPKKVTIQAR